VALGLFLFLIGLIKEKFMKLTAEDMHPQDNNECKNYSCPERDRCNDKPVCFEE